MVPGLSTGIATARPSLSPDRSWESVSVVVSDDESDVSSGKMKFKSKKFRKREKKDMHTVKYSFRALITCISRWWFCLLLLPVLLLFSFEISKSAKSEGTDMSFINYSDWKAGSNLNRLDMPTRSVSGVRQPCLDLLAAKDIERLELPSREFYEDPVRVLLYAESRVSQGTGDSLIDSNHLQIGNANFNNFTGNQTLEERHDSFKVISCFQTPDITEIFVGVQKYGQLLHLMQHNHGGFDIDPEDKRFMSSCRAVVSTCTFGGGDDLYQPIGMVKDTLKKVCYVAFWDEITLNEQAAGGKKLGKDRMIGLWRIIVVHNLPFTDQRLNGKIPKMLGHRLFPHAQYSIWVDSKSQFRRDPIAVFEALLWRTNSVIAISEHGARSCVYDEGIAIVRKHKATPEEVERQLAQYRLDGFPSDPKFDGHKALSEASVIVREHTTMTNLVMCLWFNEVVRFTSRDQLSFPYVLRHFRMLKINMFSVCTRRALVNSMGHKHKAKPLIRPNL